MTSKQITFCQEYIKDLNGTQAAIRAGYSPGTANRIASENLSKPDIKNYIRQLEQEREERTKITSDMVVKEFAKIAFCNPLDYYLPDGTIKPIHELNEEQAAAISQLEFQNSQLVKIKLHSKIQALDALAKHTGAYAAHNSQKSEMTLENLMSLPHDERMRVLIELEKKYHY